MKGSCEGTLRSTTDRKHQRVDTRRIKFKKSNCKAQQRSCKTTREWIKEADGKLILPISSSLFSHPFLPFIISLLHTPSFSLCLSLSFSLRVSFSLSLSISLASSFCLSFFFLSFYLTLFLLLYFSLFLSQGEYKTYGRWSTKSEERIRSGHQRERHPWHTADKKKRWTCSPLWKGTWEEFWYFFWKKFLLFHKTRIYGFMIRRLFLRRLQMIEICMANDNLVFKIRGLRIDSKR